MTRKRKTETDLTVSASGAAAAPRRKATARPRASRPTDVPAENPIDTENTLATAAAEPFADAVCATYEPSHEEIAALAYSFWADRGYHGGTPEQDWLRAEQELRNRTAAVAAA